MFNVHVRFVESICSVASSNKAQVQAHHPQTKEETPTKGNVPGNQNALKEILKPQLSFTLA